MFRVASVFFAVTITIIENRRERVGIDQALIRNDGSLFGFDGHLSFLNGIVDQIVAGTVFWSV
jgi:hypothetical protein